MEKMLDLRVFSTKKNFMLALLVVALVGVMVAWELNPVTYNGDSASPKDGKLVADPFEFTIALEKTMFKPYEQVNMTVTLTNIGEENVTITFTTRPNPSPYWFWKVYDDSQQLVFYHKYVGMLQAFEEITLQPGEFMQRECAWDQKATDSGQQVPPGIYYLTAVTSFLYSEKELACMHSLETQSEILIDDITGEPIVLEKVFNEVFKLTMIIPNDTYALGEPIRFALRLSNIGNEVVVIYYAWMDLLRYHVVNPSGDMIYYKTEAPTELVLPVIVDETLEPNMAHEKLFIWRQVYQDYYNETWSFDENPITTLGNYTIIGQTYFYLRENSLWHIVEAKLQIQVRII